MNLIPQTLISLLLLNSAQAVVIFHEEIVQIGRIDRVPFPDEVDFDVNRDGIADVKVRAFRNLNFGHLGTYVLGSPSTTEFVTETIQLHTGRTTTLIALSIDQSIGDPSQSFLDAFTTGGIISEFSSDSFPKEVTGPFADQAAYLGFRFLVDDDFHYGYLHLRGEGATGATVFGYAWETEPGRAIAAGAILEPSTALFTLFGLFICSKHRKRGE